MLLRRKVLKFQYGWMKNCQIWNISANFPGLSPFATMAIASRNSVIPSIKHIRYLLCLTAAGHYSRLSLGALADCDLLWWHGGSTGHGGRVRHLDYKHALGFSQESGHSFNFIWIFELWKTTAWQWGKGNVYFVLSHITVLFIYTKNISLQE